MNIFCLTLQGSTESIYKPACSQTLKDVIPNYQCSPVLLRHKHEWGGSDPSISSMNDIPYRECQCDTGWKPTLPNQGSTLWKTAKKEQPQNELTIKRNSKWSCVPTSLLENQTSEKDINHACWSPGDKKDLCRTKKVQNRGTCKAPCQNSKLTRADRGKQLKSDRTWTDLPAQDSEMSSETAESMQTTGRLKKLQNLMQAKNAHRSGAAKEKSTSVPDDHLPDVLSNNNPVLTCLGLGKGTEKPWKTALSPQQQQAKVHEDAEEEIAWSPGVVTHLWNPFECPQPCTPLYHSCHQARRELWVCGGTLSLPPTTKWDCFESVVQELDNKQCNPFPQQLIRSITDLHLSQNTLSRFGRFDAFRQHSPLMKPQDNGSCRKQEQDDDPTIINGNTQIHGGSTWETGSWQPFIKGRRQSVNSLESLYSLKSGQSSSSGVTSGSDCSSNRGSLKLEGNVLYTRQFCGRARVHTDHVPSPYDTESLKLKVGDVIDIISKPPMGIWTGMLHGRIGNFKFIYVDVLTEESPETSSQLVRQKSTVREVLKRLSLEEYSSCLQLHGYQTVDDLMSLKEHHLVELNVTDPEHKRRLLAAVDSLQQLLSDSQLENEVSQEAETSSENMKAGMNRDSSCHMLCDSPHNHTGHRLHQFPSEHPLSAETTAA